MGRSAQTARSLLDGGLAIIARAGWGAAQALLSGGFRTLYGPVPLAAVSILLAELWGVFQALVHIGAGCTLTDKGLLMGRGWCTSPWGRWFTGLNDYRLAGMNEVEIKNA